MNLISINKVQFRKIKYSALIAFLTLFSGTSLVSAEEIIITGNGSDTTSTVTNTTVTTANVTQNNSQDTTNDIQTESNTGNNDTSGNTGGENNIVTGNITTDVDVTNTGNSNSSDLDCCNLDNSTTALISGNGTGSENQLNIVSLNTSSVNSGNAAKITNTIIGSANTGNNTASNNSGGNTYIKTGNISVSENITNGPLNYNNAASVINAIKTGNYNLKIAGNGSYSVNNINLDLLNENNIKVNNALDFLNESVWLLNSGHNYANENTGGNVNILTGDIEFIASIINGPINVNEAEVVCCGDKVKIEEPTGGLTPINSEPAAKVESKPSESKPSDGGSSKGEVLATALGAILPATGNNTFLFLMIGNVAMFLLGMVLRLRSGNSPGLAKVVA